MTYDRCLIRAKVIANRAKIVQDWQRFVMGPLYITEEVAQVVLNVLNKDNRYVVAIPPCSDSTQGDAREAMVVIPLFEGKTEYVFKGARRYVCGESKGGGTEDSHGFVALQLGHVVCGKADYGKGSGHVADEKP
jgi:hypothetical protein